MHIFHRFGYVEFSSVADATKAFKKFNNKELDGRNLVLDYAAERSGGGGGFGGRGGGGFGGGGGGGFSGGGGGFGGRGRGRGGSGPRGGGGRGRGGMWKFIFEIFTQQKLFS